MTFSILPLTYIKDIDIVILSYIDDNNLESISQINKYLNNLYYSPYLWQLKIIKKHIDFPIINGYNYMLYKKLYYKLKFKQYTDIIIWCDNNGMLDIINWLINNYNYKKYFIESVQTFLYQITKLYINNRVIATDNLFNFLYNNRFFLELHKNFKDTLKDKLLLLINDTVYHKKAILYMKLIFNE